MPQLVISESHDDSGATPGTSHGQLPGHGSEILSHAVPPAFAFHLHFDWQLPVAEVVVDVVDPAVVDELHIHRQSGVVVVLATVSPHPVVTGAPHEFPSPTGGSQIQEPT